MMMMMMMMMMMFIIIIIIIKKIIIFLLNTNPPCPPMPPPFCARFRGRSDDRQTAKRRALDGAGSSGEGHERGLCRARRGSAAVRQCGSGWRLDWP